jgi:hypothetical protein
MKTQARFCLPAILAAIALLWCPVLFGQAEEHEQNVILVSLDGVRWQEVFGGIDAAILEDPRFSHEPAYLKEAYWHEDKAVRRRKLFPFLSSVVANEGTLIGDRNRDSFMEVSNDQWFSYPGYNEILTGRADPAIDSNDKVWNKNVTLLEVLDGLDDFHERVYAFASWDVFPYIVNVRRSGLPVNAGFDIATEAPSAAAQRLNELSANAPKLWSTVRLDFLTHGYAMDALESKHPRVTYIAYGETDDFAHDGNYDRYLDAAYRTDRMLSDIWDRIQTEPDYRNRTTLIVTTDHGRGSEPESWTSHDNAADSRGAPAGLENSNEIWFAAIGPCIKPSGLVAGNWKQSQVAATVLSCLRLDPARLMPEADRAMSELLRE